MAAPADRPKSLTSTVSTVGEHRRAPKPTSVRVEAFAVCAPGLEPFVAAEMRRVGVASVVERHGGVSCTASWPQVWQVNLWSRCASRVLLRIARFTSTTFVDFEAGLRRIDWSAWLPDDAQVSVSAASSNSTLYHTGAIEERALVSLTAGGTRRVGAIRSGSAERSELSETGLASTAGADTAGSTRDAMPILGASGEPLNADGSAWSESPTTDPPVSVLIRIVHDQVTVSIDTSGEPLYKRGWRVAVAKAPIRETLAAGLIAASGWDGKSPLIDPFCGSGTLAIEGLLAARRMAPGRFRAFAFESFPTFEADRWATLLAAADADIVDRRPVVIGSDRDAGAIIASASNAERAGVGDLIEWREAAISDLRMPAGKPGTLVANPPYGARIGVAPPALSRASQVGGVGAVTLLRSGEFDPETKFPRRNSTVPLPPRTEGVESGGDIDDDAAPGARGGAFRRPSGRDTEADLRNLYDRWGQVVRSSAPGWKVAIVAQQGQLLDSFASKAGLTLDVATSTSNGGIPVVFVKGVVPTGSTSSS